MVRVKVAEKDPAQGASASGKQAPGQTASSLRVVPQGAGIHQEGSGPRKEDEGSVPLANVEGPNFGFPGPNGACPKGQADRKSTRLNSSHSQISYAVFCLKKKRKHMTEQYDH